MLSVAWSVSFSVPLCHSWFLSLSSSIPQSFSQFPTFCVYLSLCPFLSISCKFHAVCLGVSSVSLYLSVYLSRHPPTSLLLCLSHSLLHSSTLFGFVCLPSVTFTVSSSPSAQTWCFICALWIKAHPLRMTQFSKNLPHLFFNIQCGSLLLVIGAIKL